VLRAIDAIPVDFRLTVILADLQDFSYKEIADILDVPVGTVMSRLFRGRRLLQKELAEYATASGVLHAGRDDGTIPGASVDLEAWKRRRGIS
jgi:RNA polymerase sigma-70 factor (ECF subfamily)